MTMKPLQVSALPLHPSQATNVALQATTIPAATAAQTGLDIDNILNLMITMMIVVMMMKMMGGAMTGLGSST